VRGLLLVRLMQLFSGGGGDREMWGVDNVSLEGTVFSYIKHEIAVSQIYTRECSCRHSERIHHQVNHALL
jgi:hypothetical protein